jgi:hypothetical protein
MSPLAVPAWSVEEPCACGWYLAVVREEVREGCAVREEARAARPRRRAPPPAPVQAGHVVLADPGVVLHRRRGPAGADLVEDVVAAGVRARHARLRPGAGRGVQAVRVQVGRERVVEDAVVGLPGRHCVPGGRRGGRGRGGAGRVGQVVRDAHAQRRGRVQPRARPEEVHLPVDIVAVDGRGEGDGGLLRTGREPDAHARRRQRDAKGDTRAGRQQDLAAGQVGDGHARADVDHGQAVLGGRGAGSADFEERHREREEERRAARHCVEEEQEGGSGRALRKSAASGRAEG